MAKSPPKKNGPSVNLGFKAELWITADKLRNLAASPHTDVLGSWKSATTASITAHGQILTLGRYIVADEVEEDGAPSKEKTLRVVARNSRILQDLK